MTTKLYALAQVKAVEDAEGDPNGEFDLILSTDALDRDGEVIDARAFGDLPEHITFDYDHGMSVATTVGSGVPSYTEEGYLRVKGTYSSIPRAQEVRTLVREGHIRTASVAFMGAERETKDGTTHIVSAELLNGAFVAIPSNRDARVLSAKAYEDAKATTSPCPTCAAKSAPLADEAPEVSTLAPDAPAPAAGKHPASTVGEFARLRAELIALS